MSKRFPSQRFERSLIALTLVSLLCGDLSAQSKPKETEDEFQIRHLYVPLESLENIANEDRFAAILSRSEFDKLVKEAREAAASKPNAPQTPVLSEAVYEANVDGERLTANVNIRIATFAEQWNNVDINIEGWNVEKALFGEASAIAQRINTKQLRVLIEGAGEQTLSLTLSMPLRAVGSDKVAVVGLPNTSAGHFQMTVPKGKHLSVGGQSLSRPAEIDQPAEYLIPVGGQSTVELKITDRQESSRSDVLTFASTAYGVQVMPSEITWVANTQLQVYGKSIDQLTCKIPNSLEITAVESTGLESWELSDAPKNADQTVIALQYRQSFSGNRTITFRGILSSTPNEAWTIPNLQLPQITSHVGNILITHPENLRLQTIEADGVRAYTGPISIQLSPDTAALQFQVWEEVFDLSFVAALKEQQVHAAMTNVLDVTSLGLDLYTTLSLQSRLAPLFDARLRIPADWQIAEVLVNGKAAVWDTVPADAGINELRITLDPPLNPGENRTATVLARAQPEHWPVETEPVLVSIPEIRLPQAAMVEALYGIAADSDLEVVGVDVIGLDPARQPDVELLNQKLRGLGKQVRFGFTYQDSVFSGQLSVSRKPATLTAETLTFFRIDEETIFTRLEAILNVTGGGVRELSLEISEAAGEDMRFTLLPWGQANMPVKIVEQSSSAPADGKRIWTLKLDQYIQGGYLLATESRIPREEAEEYSPIQMSIPDSAIQTGFIAIEGAADEHIQYQATSADGLNLAIVDPVDFPRGQYQPRQRMVAGFRSVHPGWQVSVSTDKFDRGAIPTAIGHKLQLTSVLGEAGEFQHQATISFTAFGAQSLIINLPENAVLWSTLINNQPVEVRQLPAGVQVPLTGTQIDGAKSEQVHTLKLLYSTSAPELTGVGELKSSPPVVSVLDGTGEQQPLEVLHHSWELNYPEETLLVSSPGLFQPNETLTQDSTLSQLWKSIRLPSLGALWNRTIALVIAAVVLFLLAKVVKANSGRSYLFSVVSIVALLLICTFIFSNLMLSSQMDNARHFDSGMAANEVEFSDEYMDGPFGALEAPMPTSGEMASPAEDAPEMGGVPILNKIPDLSKHNRPQAATQLADSFEMEQPSFGGFEPNEPVEQQLKQLVDQFNGLMNQRRYEEAHAIAKRAKQIAPDNAVTVSMDLKAKFAVRSDEIEKLKESKEERFYNTLEDVELSAVSPFKPGENIAYPDSWNELKQQRQPDEQMARPAALGVNGPGPGVLDNFETEGEFAGRAWEGRGTGGLLSMTVDLQIPNNTRKQVFQYQGNAADDSVDLRLRFANRNTGYALMIAIALGVGLLGWWFRSVPLPMKLFFVFATVALPLGLAGIAPTVWQMILEGVLYGGLLTLGCWCFRSLVDCCRCCCTWVWKKCQMPPLTAIMLTILCLTNSNIFAQQQAPNQQAEIQQQAVPQQAAEANSVDIDDLFMPPIVRSVEPYVVIPYETSDQKKMIGDRVWLPHDTYRKLWEATQKADLPSNDAPINSLVAEATYLAKIEQVGDEQQVAIQARWIVLSLQDQPSTVLLPVVKAAINNVTVDGKPAALQTGKADRSAVVIKGKGAHVVDAQLQLPAEVLEESGQFDMHLLPVSSGILSVEFPQSMSEQVIRVNGSTGVYRRVSDENQTRVEIPIDAGGKIAVTWRSEQQQGNQEKFVTLDSRMAVVLNDLGTHLNTSYVAKVQQGAINDLQFALPPKMSIREIRGDDIGGWEINNEEQTLRVFFRRAIDQHSKFQIDLFHPNTVEDALEITSLSSPDVSRDVGLIALFAESYLQARSGKTTGLTQINANQFSASDSLTRPKSPPLMAYRYTQTPVRWEIDVSRRAPKLAATTHHGVNISQRKQQIASLVRFNISGAPQKTLEIQLPAGYLPIDVVCEASSDWYIGGDEDIQTLIIELVEPRTGAITISLEGHVVKEPDDTEMALDMPFPLNVSQQITQAGVWFDDAYQATILEMEDWKTIPSSQLANHIRRLQPRAPQFALNATAIEPAIIDFKVERAIPELNSDAVTLIAVSDATVDYGLSLRWKISQAATDQFVFTTPEWLGDLDISAPGVRQILSEETNNGLRRWTVTLVDPIRDQYLLTAAATVPAPLDLQVKTPPVTFEEVSQTGAINPLESQRQYAILVNLSSDQLVPVDLNDFESIPVEQLPLAMEPTLVKQAMEITRVRDDKVPQWELQRMQTHGTANAIVVAVNLQTVLEQDGSWRTKANYAIRNRGRQFLALHLPGGSRVLSVFVRGKPSRTVLSEINEKPAHLIALPQTSVADLSFDIDLILAGRLPQALAQSASLTAQSISLPAPQVVSKSDSEEFGLSVAQTLWTVHAPENLDVAPAGDVKRTNLTWHGGRESFAAELQLLERWKSDIAEMKRLANSKSVSSSQRIQSKNNLRQLGLALEEQLEKVQAQDGELYGEQFEELYAGNRFLYEDLQSDLVETDSDGVILFDDSTVMPQGGRDFIISNNTAIADNNGGEGIALQQQNKGVATFNFNTIVPNQPAKKSESAKSGKDLARSDLKSKIAGQGVITKGKADRYGNSFVEDPKMSNDPFASSSRVIIAPAQPTDGKPNSGVQAEFGTTLSRQSRTPAFGDNIQLFDGRASGLTINGGRNAQPDDELSLQVEQTQRIWENVGGLSVKMDIPTNGQQLAFSKVGGNPKLTLSVRPKETWTLGIGVLWCVACLVVGAVILTRLAKSVSINSLIDSLSLIAIIVGIAGFVLLPAHLRWSFFALFCSGGLLRAILTGVSPSPQAE